MSEPITTLSDQGRTAGRASLPRRGRRPRRGRAERHNETWVSTATSTTASTTPLPIGEFNVNELLQRAALTRVDCRLTAIRVRRAWHHTRVERDRFKDAVAVARARWLYGGGRAR